MCPPNVGRMNGGKLWVVKTEFVLLYLIFITRLFNPTYESEMCGMQSTNINRTVNVTGVLSSYR
jgi:hypothetical protein